MTEPPEYAVKHAVALATRSECAKSKRGAVVFKPMQQIVIGEGMNGQPSPLECDRTERCARDCGRLCVHAESRAIHDALATQGRRGHQYPLITAQLLHVKVIDGALVASGAPSCWQCSREILDCRIGAAIESGGVWLFQESGWKLYTALEFHHQSIEAHGMARR